MRLSFPPNVARLFFTLAAALFFASHPAAAIYEVGESSAPHADEVFPSPLRSNDPCYCGDQTLWEIFVRWRWHEPDSEVPVVPQDFVGCAERIKFDETIGAPFVTRSYREDAMCPADLAANAVRCSRMELGPDHALLTHAFREAAVDYVQIAGIPCFDNTPYSKVFGITAAQIVWNYETFGRIVSEKYLEWWEYAKYEWRREKGGRRFGGEMELRQCPVPGEDVILRQEDVHLAADGGGGEGEMGVVVDGGIEEKRKEETVTADSVADSSSIDGTRAILTQLEEAVVASDASSDGVDDAQAAGEDAVKKVIDATQLAERIRRIGRVLRMEGVAASNAEAVDKGVTISSLQGFAESRTVTQLVETFAHEHTAMLALDVEVAASEEAPASSSFGSSLERLLAAALAKLPAWAQENVNASNNFFAPSLATFVSAVEKEISTYVNTMQVAEISGDHQSEHVQLLCALPLVWPAERDFRRAILDTWGRPRAPLPSAGMNGKNAAQMSSCDEVLFFVAPPDGFCEDFCAARKEERRQAQRGTPPQAGVELSLSDVASARDVLTGRRLLFSPRRQDEKNFGTTNTNAAATAPTNATATKSLEDLEMDLLCEAAPQSEVEPSTQESGLDLRNSTTFRSGGGDHRSDWCLPFGVVNLRRWFPQISADRTEFSYKYSDKDFSWGKKVGADQDKNTVPKVLHMIQFIQRTLPAYVFGDDKDENLGLQTKLSRLLHQYFAMEEKGQEQRASGGTNAVDDNSSDRARLQVERAAFLQFVADARLESDIFVTNKAHKDLHKPDKVGGAPTGNLASTPAAQASASASSFWTCRLERDTWFFPSNFRRLVSSRKLAVTDWHNLGVAHLYELWDGRRPWNDGGPGVCLSGGALDRLARFLWKMEDHLNTELDGYYGLLPGLDPEQCQPYAKGFREDKFLNACLSEARVFPDAFSIAPPLHVATVSDASASTSTSNMNVVRDEFGRDAFVIVPYERYYAYGFPVNNPMRGWIHRENPSWNYFKGRTGQFLHCSGYPGRMPRLVWSNFPVSFNSFKEIDWFYDMQRMLGERARVEDVEKDESII
mmetsp:Transcript_3720/g.9027  ORF Transcript_3720/g.9027 Transcript_3720/m.9027 type:complete len:1065 (-) Transcript_3720:118-3312(-)